MLSKIFYKLTLAAALYLTSLSANAVLLSIGPADNNALFWIDQDNPNQDIPSSFQKWGLVFTAPSGQDILSSASFYVSSSSSASGFKVRMSEWSPSALQPTGLTIYESPFVSFSTHNINPPDPLRGVSPTIFSLNASIVAGNQYIFEILGDGAVGMLTAIDYADGGLYEAENSRPWIKFGNYALRSDMIFKVASVPEADTSAMLLMGAGVMGLMARRRKQAA